MRVTYHNEAGTGHSAGHVEADVDLHIRLLIRQLHYGNLETTSKLFIVDKYIILTY